MSDLRADYDALHHAAGLVDRSARGKVEAVGSEAAAFLHNLSTADVKGLRPWAGREAFWCNATARVIAHGYLWRGADDGKRQAFWLDVPGAAAGKLFGHLDRHLISEDVTLTDRTAELAQLHLAGPAAADVLKKAGLPHEDAPLTWGVADGLQMRRVDALGIPGWDLLCPVADADALRAHLLKAGARQVGPEAAEVVRVEAGVPEFGADVDESTFAPEVGRTATAISYNKGCYLGQEPIVMARDRGVVQRTLVRLGFADDVPAGSILIRDGKEVGRVTSSVVSPARGRIGLGYVRRGSQAPGTALEAQTPQGPRAAEVAAG